jgi:hypothetical protein
MSKNERVFKIKNKDGLYSHGGKDGNISWKKQGRLWRSYDLYQHLNVLEDVNKTYKDCIIESYDVVPREKLTLTVLFKMFDKFDNKRKEKMKKRYLNVS